MAVYNFLAIAPCSFVIDQKAFNLKAGDPFSTNETIGEKLLSPHFTYSNYVRLIQGPPIKVEQAEAPEVAVVEPVYEQTEPTLFDEQVSQEIEEPKVEVAVETEVKKYIPKTRKKVAEKLAEEEIE
jgi:hypothetical protein